LASADPDPDPEMALWIMDRAITGLMLENAVGENERQLEVTMRYRKGGETRADRQHEEAAAIWQPYVTRFRSLVAAGKAVKEARAIVVSEMTIDEFKLPYQKDAFPSSPTITKWLKVK
jgi:hypothetical protein